MTHYIYSTLSADQNYTIYKESVGGKPSQALKSVYIKGGANVIDAKHLITPKGVLTTVTNDEYEALKQCDSFIRHMKAGYILVEEKKIAVDKAIESMNKKDKSAPATKKDINLKLNTKKT